MKLTFFAILLINLAACEENCAVKPSDSANNSVNSNTASDKSKFVLDNKAELQDFFQKVIGEDISPILNELNNAKNLNEEEIVFKKLAQKINTKDNNGFTAFHKAISENNNDVVIESMIKAGVDVNEAERNNIVPLQYAINVNNEKLLEILINAPSIDLAKADTLKWAIEQGNLKIAKTLLDKKVKLDKVDENGYTYLHQAVLKKKAEILKELLDTKTIDINTKDNNGNTLLHLARDVGIAQVLIEAGADVNIENKFNETPLTIADKFKKEDIKNLLIKKGAKIISNNKAVDKKDDKVVVDFMSTEFSYSYAIPTINMSTTKQYDGYAPKAPFIADYAGNGVRSIMAIKLANSFSKNLPDKIKEELKKYKIEEDKTDIFLIIQGLNQIDEKTQIKAHGWADPDAPYESNDPYDRVNRNFLYGVYESDKDISDKVRLEELKEFPVYTHLHQDKATGPWQIVYSPPEGAIINIANDERSNMSFYSLVIDNKNPEGNIKAAVTLHWLLVGEIPFQKEIYADSKRGDRKYLPPSGIGPENESPVIKKYQNIGELINFWQNKSFLKDTSLVKKLTDLIK